MSSFNGIVSGALRGERLQPEDALALASCDDLELLSAAAGRLRDQGHGPRVSYSPKVFIPADQLCATTYCCTFFPDAEKTLAPYLSPDQVLAIARRRRGELPRRCSLGDQASCAHATARWRWQGR
jgi:FO synthase